jgi:ABC-2 type transport system ATP-binding protein
VNDIESIGLGKRYGHTWALRDCALAIPSGHVTALVGPNGAGKTTLLHLAVGLARPTNGAIAVCGGVPAGSPAALERVGFVAQDAPLYRGLSVADTVHLAGNLNWRWDQQRALARLADLGIPLSKKAGALSGGQQAQLALTLALARMPSLLLLDEPLARLDPLARHDFLASLMTAVSEDGVSVVFSSHVLAELERVADYLIVLACGRVQLAGDVDELVSGHQTLIGPTSQATNVADRLAVVSERRGERHTHLLVRCARHMPPPAGWQSHPSSLEELVLAYLRAPDAAALPGPNTKHSELRAAATT